MRLVTVLAAILLTVVVTAFAQGAPDERSSLIQLGSRVFDLGTDVRRIQREPHFIPVTDVDWISALADSDPYLHATVIHIRTLAHLLGTPIWPPEEDRVQYAPARDLADAWALKDFDVHWRHKVAPSTRGDIMLFPKSSKIEYYVGCAYDRADPIPTFCAVNALYPPDPNLRIKVRIYQITDPLNDFRAIVERTLNLIYCLDVTKELEAGKWRPMEIGASQDMAEFLSTCKNISS